MTPKLFILGIGNETRGDDAVGIIVTRSLGRRLKDVAQVESNSYVLWNLLQSGFSQSNLALIDAAKACAGFEVGGWRRFEYPDQTAAIKGAGLCNTHSVDVVSMLQLGQTMQTLPPHVRIYAVAATEFGMTCSLTPTLADRLPHIEAEIENDLVQWMESVTCTSSR